jgi:hypothetical protein
MNKNYFKKEFDIKGFFKIEKFIDKDNINKILSEIESVKDADIYYDRNNKIRRIEQIYNKRKYLNRLNLNFISMIDEYLGKKVAIFKDKFNAKPPGGEGFSAHYDGIFKFIDNKGVEKNGWYHYDNFFLNVLLALDKCSEENGTIEIANSHSGDFNDLIKNTTNDGTPNLQTTIEEQTHFEKIFLEIGDLVIFKNTCAHRSAKNYSNTNRRILYYTYSSFENGSKYKDYFTDKKNSNNKKSKSLAGEL